MLDSLHTIFIDLDIDLDILTITAVLMLACAVVDCIINGSEDQDYDF